MLLVGSHAQLPAFDGRLYLADAATCGEYNPEVHKKLILSVIDKEQPDAVVFSHSSYGWTWRRGGLESQGRPDFGGRGNCRRRL